MATLLLVTRVGCCLCEGLEEKLRAAAVNQDGDFQVKPGQQLGIQVHIHGFKGDRGADGERVLPRFSPRLGASQLAGWLTQQGVH